MIKTLLLSSNKQLERHTRLVSYSVITFVIYNRQSADV
jgi:hypothetical protein